jgi:hypothetical protein
VVGRVSPKPSPVATSGPWRSSLLGRPYPACGLRRKVIGPENIDDAIDRILAEHGDED